MKNGKCNFNSRATSWQAREVGCQLDHCMCGYHTDDSGKCLAGDNCRADEHVWGDWPDEREAELDAGWDPSP